MYFECIKPPKPIYLPVEVSDVFSCPRFIVSVFTPISFSKADLTDSLLRSNVKCTFVLFSWLSGTINCSLLHNSLSKCDFILRLPLSADLVSFSMGETGEFSEETPKGIYGFCLGDFIDNFWENMDLKSDMARPGDGITAALGLPFTGDNSSLVGISILKIGLLIVLKSLLIISIALHSSLIASIPFLDRSSTYIVDN